MSRLIRNLLDMVRLEVRDAPGAEGVVSAGGGRRRGADPARRPPPAHPVRTTLPADLPLLPMDGLLMEQVLINLLENAIKHTPSGTADPHRAHRWDRGRSWSKWRIADRESPRVRRN